LSFFFLTIILKTKLLGNSRILNMIPSKININVFLVVSIISYILFYNQLHTFMITSSASSSSSQSNNANKANFAIEHFDDDIPTTENDEVQTTRPPSLKSRSEKYIAYECDIHSKYGLYDCGGWADRLMGVMGAYALSLITNRTFLLNIVRPCMLTSMLLPNEVPWSEPIPRESSNPTNNNK
jgi:hypothetical protein